MIPPQPRYLEKPPDWTPQERPKLPGSPANLAHSRPIMVLYFVVGLFVTMVGGLGNGIITATRVRMPYIFQAVVYAVIYREGGYVHASSSSITFVSILMPCMHIYSLRERLRFVMKQLLFHGRNLAMYVGIYKSICCLFRSMGISGGIESLIAGMLCMRA